ncbi:MAG: crosslink repair DNA glycosylase YcaQ family protein [bacterium]|nr:crosslink repair DNA glycosylase YcaQ family protein [bacterium]
MNTQPITISAQTYRRFLLGKQGLYPGRRWQGKAGAAAAIRAVEAVQIDPLNITARNHDLTLHSRVLDYEIAHLDELAHQDRSVFDFGNLLFYYPIEDLPYFRPVMRWWVEHSHYREIGLQYADLIEQVRGEVRQHGAVGNRHFAGTARVESYRASKDTGLALRYLWLSGELITHSRTRFERNFAFSANVIPPEYQWTATDAQTLDRFTRKALSFAGIAPRTLWSRNIYALYERRHPQFESAIKGLIEGGDVVSVRIEGRKDVRYMLAADVPHLETLANGAIPAAWTPLETTTEQEVVFMPPLDIVTGRKRAFDVFGFDYLWEVYKPAHQRRWGYYCLPILYGDRLVGRFDPKMERKTRTLVINGFWLEDDFTPDADFAAALGRGLARFARFNGAASVDTGMIAPQMLQAQVKPFLT